jgi:hypothetical protein
MTEFGNMALVEEREEQEGGSIAIRLPGVRSGDMAARAFKPEVRVYCLQFSPTGNCVLKSFLGDILHTRIVHIVLNYCTLSCGRRCCITAGFHFLYLFSSVRDSFSVMLQNIRIWVGFMR